MSREIKFKAWDKINKKMLTWEEIWDQDLVRDIFIYDGDYIPLQFTGLKDSEGNEIYEGDILGNLTVSYVGDLQESLSMDCGWYLQRGDFESYTKLVCDNYYLIKGNIYEGLKIDL